MFITLMDIQVEIFQVHKGAKFFCDTKTQEMEFLRLYFLLITEKQRKGFSFEWM